MLALLVTVSHAALSELTLPSNTTEPLLIPIYNIQHTTYLPLPTALCLMQLSLQQKHSAFLHYPLHPQRRRS